MKSFETIHQQKNFVSLVKKLLKINWRKLLTSGMKILANSSDDQLIKTEDLHHSAFLNYRRK